MDKLKDINELKQLFEELLLIVYKYGEIQLIIKKK